MSPFSSVASPPGPLMTSTAALPSRPSSSSSAANSGVCLMGGLTTRNLTAIFLKHRQEHRRKRFRFGQSLLASSHEEEPDRAHATGSQRLLSADREDGDVSIEMSDQLPPLWVDMVEEANDDITHIKEKSKKNNNNNNTSNSPTTRNNNNTTTTTTCPSLKTLLKNNPLP
eukprot:GHVT01029710.1.p1 GENE.GHVT01029710.1~~GHVT01029710.1.p1  ORF type:complete len:170 (+),score=51.66 GHVT01029710.1:624-1133(+)